MYRIILFFVVLLVAACNRNSSKTDGVGALAEKSYKTPPTGYYLINGHIHDTPVYVNLHITDQAIRGSYTDERTGRLVHLVSMAYPPVADSILLLAAPYRAMDAMVADDTLMLVYEKNAFSGFRKRSGVSPAPVLWNVVSDNSAIQFDPIRIKDSIIMPEGPAAYIDLEMMAPALNTTDTLGARLHQWIVRLGLAELNETTNKSETAAQRYVSKYLNDFKTNMQRAVAGSEMDFTSPVYQYQQQRVMNVLYNRKGLLVLSNYIFDYSGGAHPNHVTHIRCFDIRQQKELKWDDVFKVAPEQMSGLMETHFRLTRGLKSETPLKSILFEDKILPNQNFYITHAGVGFWYVPYEIAAYVFGDTEVFIPFEDLKPFVREDILKRFE